MLETKDIEENQARLEQLYKRWIVGAKDSLALEQLPTDWQIFLSDVSAERLPLLALAFSSQYQLMMLLQEQPQQLLVKPELPQLDFPVIPDSLRPIFRRVVEVTKRSLGLDAKTLLNLLWVRKFVAHPSDWLPSAKDEDIPKAYWAWSKWSETNRGSFTGGDITGGDITGGDKSIEQLTAETWDEFYPAERNALLRELRRQDSGRARELIVSCAAKEPAEKRLKIIETLAINLSVDDAEVLQALLTDRSQKIVQLAYQLLARLGFTESLTAEAADNNAAKDLAEGFEIKKTGLLKKRYLLVPLKLKSKKQQSIRSELISKVPLSDFAKSLAIVADDLVSMWHFGENRDHDNQGFVMSAVATASDGQIALLLENALANIDSSDSMLQYIKLLLPRLPDEAKKIIFEKIFSHKSIKFDFCDCLAFIDAPLQEISFETLQGTPAWKALLESLRTNLSDGGYVDSHFVICELTALGLFLPAACAEDVLQYFGTLGMFNADPALDSLNLNIKLNLTISQG